MDRIEFIAGGDTIAPGLTVIDTPGHTPGHISLRLSSGDNQLYLTADVLHGKMQLQEPTWSVAFDLDAEVARHSREQLYRELIQPNTIVVVNHFSDNVFGRIIERDGQKEWVALE